MSSRLALALVCCLPLTALAGCGGSDDSAPEGSSSVPKASGRLVEDGTFRLSLAFDPGSLDVIGNAGIERQLPLFLYDALVATVNGKDIKPNLASRWRVSPRKAVFTIRDGVTCSDGSPVTPRTIAKSFGAFKTPRAQMRPFGDLSDWTVEGDDAAGTVTFRFGRPVGFPLHAVADVPVICGKGLANPKLLRRQSSGSGPYVLTKAVSNDRYTLTRRDGYRWGPDGATTAEPGMPKTVEMRVVTNPSTSTNLFLSGDLDEAALPRSAGERLRGHGRSIPVPRDVGQLLYNNASNRPTGDPAVRRALTMAVDRKELAAVAKGTVLDTLTVPYTSPCTDASAAAAIPAHDLDAANKLLDEAGWRRGSGGVRAKDGKRLQLESFSVNDMAAEWKAAGELVARRWRELGAEVKSRTLSGSAAYQTLSSGDWDAFPLSAITEVNPAAMSGLITGPAPPKGPNLLRIDNPAYVKAAKAALDARSEKQACAAWSAAERELYERADIVPVVVSNRLYAMQENIDLAVSIFGVVPTSVRIHEG